MRCGKAFSGDREDGTISEAVRTGFSETVRTGFSETVRMGLSPGDHEDGTNSEAVRTGCLQRLRGWNDFEPAREGSYDNL